LKLITLVIGFQFIASNLLVMDKEQLQDLNRSSVASIFFDTPSQNPSLNTEAPSLIGPTLNCVSKPTFV